MNRRQFTKRGLITLTIAGFSGSAFNKCSVSKEKAVRVAGFVIDLSKDALPLLDLLGAHDISELLSTKALPALQKLKDALANADIPESRTTLETVRNLLDSAGTALLNLPASARRTTIIGILASVNILLLTVEAFIQSEATGKIAVTVAATSVSRTDEAVLKVFEATRQ